MTAVNEEKLKAIFKRDGLEKVELDLTGSKYFDRNKKFMRGLADQERRRIADARYENSIKTPWHKTWWWPLLSTLVGGVLLAAVLYKLGLI